MTVLRIFGRAAGAIARTLWTGDLFTKLLVIAGLAIATGLLGSVAGPVTTGLAQLLLVGAFLFAIYAVALRR